MQAAAKRAAGGETLAELARGVGRAAVTCGQCHTQFGKGPTYDASAPAEGRA